MLKKFNWVKKGLLYSPGIAGFTHASHPCIVHVEEDRHVVAFTCRDSKMRSHVFLSNAFVKNGIVSLEGEPRLALYPGATGYFDCDGAISVCFLKHADRYFLYYVGWQNLPDGMWICDTGRVNVDINSLSLIRVFPGPVLGRDKNKPLFAAGTAFLVDKGKWHTWFNSGIRWEQTENGLKHYYGIHHGTSENGIDWDCESDMCIPFADEYEYAFGRPTVTIWDGVYYMWFAHRATKTIDSYRIGFASSKDGLKWERNDALAGIEVSPEGWDSEMICYPYIFEHKGLKYMLYNGNGYGRTGFGYAILEEE